MSRFSLVLGVALLAGGAVSRADDVDTHIKQLGSSDFRQRDIAHKALLKLRDDPVTAQKLREAAQSPDAERRNRAEQLLEPYLQEERKKAIAAEMAKIRSAFSGIFPCIDLSPSVHPDVVKHYFGKADGSAGGPAFVRFRKATALLLDDMEANGVEPQMVEALLEQMKADELRWIDRCNKKRATTYANPWATEAKK